MSREIADLTFGNNDALLDHDVEPKMIRPPTNLASFKRKAPNFAYWLAYTIIAATVLVVNLTTDALRYADMDTYIYYLNSLVYFPPDSLMYFEVFSNIYLLASYWFMQSDVYGVVLAHYVLGFIFVLGLRFVIPPGKASWAALLFTFALVGPLLAFVTIRATPAYFLVAVATQLAMNRRWTSWVILSAAAMFHISALLAAIPMAILYFDHVLPEPLRDGGSRKISVSIILAIAVFGAVIPTLSVNITDLIQSIPVISKYSAYAISGSSETKIEHLIFFGFVASLTVLFMIAQTTQSKKLTSYVIASFVIYAVIFFSTSPVAAYRQAPFWLISLIAVLPWARVGVKGPTVYVFVMICAGMFAFQFQGVYS
ncbi:EpsG family protein [Terasakiella pusilla]|uniref:EpsG family protein n=1 Tax=Terasakiella pusilla TaxID=64973 RepID=UPI003AA9D48C